jgi:TonB family protein
VFESVFLETDASRRRSVNRYRWISLVVHGVALALAITLHFSSGAPDFPVAGQHVVLLAPRPPSLPALRRRALPQLPASKLTPRVFHGLPAPVVAVAPRILIDPAMAPAIELRQPVIAPPELARISLPPPPPKLNNLTDAVASAALSVAAKASVQQGGFGGAFGNTHSSATARRGAVLALAGFGESSVASAARVVEPSLPASTRPVEILAKPRPLYSEEARRLQIEGDVLLELLFPAAGEPRVLRVVQALGHGLDESATVAAQGIRFHPAQRGGVPVDFTAVVRIIFQLVY